MRTILLITIATFIISCESKVEELQVLQGNAFGTTYTIQYFTDDFFDAEKGIDSVIYSVNKSVSTYMPNSDISKINKGDSTVVVDEIFREVFRLSEEIHKQSNGYFDPTIGVLRNAYGFGDVKPLKKIDSLTLDSLLNFVGFQKVTLASDNHISKELPQIYFDFNAVAKGYGIDKIGEFLESKGVRHYVIELGGEILAKGENLQKDQAWTSGIEAIDSAIGNRSYEAVVRLNNEAMAASGNYRKFRIDSATGKKYVHTINPLTGLAEESDVTSATVIANTCAAADAYATTFMALGLSKSKALLNNLSGIEAYLTFNDSLGNNLVYTTKGFEDRLKN